MRFRSVGIFSIRDALSARRSQLQQDLAALTQRLLKARVVETYVALAVRVGEPDPSPHDTVESLLPLALEKTCQLQRIGQILEMHEGSDSADVSSDFSSDVFPRARAETMACDLAE